MFTGIVDHEGEILSVSKNSIGIRLNLGTQFKNFQEGESIAVDGVCLTVVASTESTFEVELSPETIELTIAQNYRPGTRVNLERSLRLGDSMGGHWVTGHVDQRVQLREKKIHGDYVELQFFGVISVNLLTKKGSVTLNGVSLTVNEVLDGGLSVMLIPHTLARTNLKYLKPGDWINAEFDWMAKLITQEVRRVLSSQERRDF